MARPPFSLQNTQFCTSGKVLAYRGIRCPFHLAVFNSPISGHGLKVTYGKISTGWPVLRYVGPILTDAEVLAYWARLVAVDPNPRIALFSLDEQRTIDGTKAVAAFVNHSCAPNLGVYIEPAKDTVAFYALREIFQGEELTIDYNLSAHGTDRDGHQLHPCKCGAESCRGYLESPEEIYRVQVLMKTKGA
jgi:hypothetical protein